MKRTTIITAIIILLIPAGLFAQKPKTIHIMEFPVFPDLISDNSEQRDVMIIACYSKHFFKRYIHDAGANPVLWTNGLLSAEAYTLHDAISGWIQHENGEEIRSRAARAYHKYQNCGIKGATNLFGTGY